MSKGAIQKGLRGLDARMAKRADRVPKRFVATVKWDGGNSRCTVSVEAPNQRVARERAILTARFTFGLPSYVKPIVSFHR